MSSWPDDLSVNQLIRQWACGVVFVISLRGLESSACWLQDTKHSELQFGAITLVFGILIHAITRALLIPFFESWKNPQCLNGFRALQIDDSEIRRIIQRWNLKAGADNQRQIYAKELRNWADQAHILYSSSVAILLSLALELWLLLTASNTSTTHAPQAWLFSLMMIWVILIVLSRDLLTDLPTNCICISLPLLILPPYCLIAAFPESLHQIFMAVSSLLLGMRAPLAVLLLYAGLITDHRKTRVETVVLKIGEDWHSKVRSQTQRKTSVDDLLQPR